MPILGSSFSSKNGLYLILKIVSYNVTYTFVVGTNEHIQKYRGKHAGKVKMHYCFKVTVSPFADSKIAVCPENLHY